MRDEGVVGPDIPGGEKGNAAVVATIEEEILGETFGKSGLGGDNQEGSGLAAQETGNEMGAARTGQRRAFSLRSIRSRSRRWRGRFLGTRYFCQS